MPLTTLLLVTATMIAQPPPSDHVTVRMIVVGSADEAAQVVQRLTNGADFAVLAKSLSIDPTADSGGWLGRVAVSSLRPELRRALEGLKPGQVSPFVRIPTGFAILTVVPETDAGRIESPAPATLNPGVAASGSVKYMLSVDGLAEVTAALQAFPKPEDWNQDPRTICQTRTQAVADAIASMERALLPASEARARWQPLDEVQAHHLLAELYAYRGQMGDVIAHFQKARELAVAAVPAAVPQLDESLGIAYLHRVRVRQRRSPQTRRAMSAVSAGDARRRGPA